MTGELQPGLAKDGASDKVTARVNIKEFEAMFKNPGEAVRFIFAAKANLEKMTDDEINAFSSDLESTIVRLSAQSEAREEWKQLGWLSSGAVITFSLMAALLPDQAAGVPSGSDMAVGVGVPTASLIGTLGMYQREEWKGEKFRKFIYSTINTVLDLAQEELARRAKK